MQRPEGEGGPTPHGFGGHGAKGLYLPQRRRDRRGVAPTESGPYRNEGVRGRFFRGQRSIFSGSEVDFLGVRGRKNGGQRSVFNRVEALQRLQFLSHKLGRADPLGQPIVMRELTIGRPGRSSLPKLKHQKAINPHGSRRFKLGRVRCPQRTEVPFSIRAVRDNRPYQAPTLSRTAYS